MNPTIIQYVARALVLLLCLPIHECSHGYVAYKLGDPTAKNQGRLTINPIKHLDILGAIALLVVGIGWAKPVPINPNYFKNKKAGMAISAIAGPLSNFILAFIAMIIYKIIFFLTGNINTLSGILFYYAIIINIALAIFNMLPIPPLDGSRVLSYFLPERIYFGIMRYEQYIMIGLILLLYSGILNPVLIFLNNSVFSFLDFTTGFVDKLMLAIVR